MQLVLILGIAFALVAVMFALQNNVPVTVTLLVWRFDSSIAVVLLVALTVGAFIAALVSTPAVIKGGWANSRQRRRIAELEAGEAEKTRRIADLEAQVARLTPAPPSDAAEPKPYVGLKTLITGGDASDSKAG